VIPYPSEVEKARAALRDAAAAGASILPCGRRTRLHRHAPDAAPDRWLELRSLRGIVWLDAADQTCEAGAGTSPAALDQELAAHGLMLGVDAPLAEEGSLGGLFQAPDLSLLHRSLGPPRDQVLGGSWLLADGQTVRTGARVVKSVAGYDLTRLFLGSRGRLAACLTIVLRLQPRPRDLRTFRVSDPSALRSASLPDPDWFFQTDATAAWAAWRGCSPRHASLAPCSPEEFHGARARCLAAFAACPARIAHASAPAQRPHGPFDWNALQEGTVDNGAASAGAIHVPLRDASPWLHQIAAAIAPSGVPFGCRPGVAP
jgi:FAD/FMN-containing dehydrogenase